MRAFLLTMLILAGCSESFRPDDHKFTETTATGNIEGRPTLLMPIDVPGKPVSIVPFAIMERKGPFEDEDPFSKAGVSPLSRNTPMGLSFLFERMPFLPGGNVRWHNAVIKNHASGGERTILDARGVISRYQMLGTVRDNSVRVDAIVFLVSTSDTDRNGLIDDRDSAHIIMTDGEGQSPRVVTPEDAQVWGMAYNESERRAYLLVVHDADGDGEFTTLDPPQPYVLSIDGAGRAVPLVSDDSRRRISELMR